MNVQCQVCNLIVNAALPCNKEVPVAVSMFGCTVFPKVGCCIKVGDLKKKDSDYVKSEAMERE